MNETPEEIRYVARLTRALIHGMSIPEAEEWAASDDESEGYQGDEMDQIVTDTLNTQGYWAE